MSFRELRQKIKEKAWKHGIVKDGFNVPRCDDYPYKVWEEAVWLEDVLALLDLQEKQLREEQTSSYDKMYELFQEIVMKPRDWKGFFATEFEMFAEGYFQRGKEILG